VHTNLLKYKNILILILKLKKSTNSELSLRLFMDYHGLKLLSAWMLDIDSLYDTLTQIECKIKVNILKIF